MSKIGCRIKDLRLAKGLTQEELGHILGVNKSAVQKYESGDVQNIKRDTIRKMCNFFKAYPYQFIFEDDDEYWAADSFLKFASDKYSADHVDMDSIIDFMHMKSLLNDEGFAKAMDYMRDLLLIEKYRDKP